MFKGKTLLITGGTGSFGNSVLKNFLNSDLSEIRIFSRDEKKQDDMRRTYKSDKLKFVIGDVRDPSAVRNAVRNSDFIFHAAALKQVPSCEFHPDEATKTNVIGTENILEAAITEKVQKVVCLSTDKAVYPVNAMGMSKALMEKVMIAKSRNSSATMICATRYGNVLASRGSVIPLFLSQIQNNEEITITDPLMTRFIMSLDEAVDLVLFAFLNGKPGDIFVQKSPGVSIKDLVLAIKNITNAKNVEKIIGMRHGEKMFETLLSQEEMQVAEDLGNYFRVPSDQRDLNYDKYFVSGNKDIHKSKDYTSSNTNQLSLIELEEKLLSLPIVNAFLKGESLDAFDDQ